MGLDKWLKPEDTDKNSKKKRKQEIKLVKYTLICLNKKCKYQKIIVKKKLVEKDKICPRCGKEMKIKEE
jgi:hypothetical protein